MMKLLTIATLPALVVAAIVKAQPVPIPTTDAELQIAYTLCTKRYVNRDKSVPDKWQKGYESCDQIVMMHEQRENAWNDVSQHKAKLNSIAGGK